MSDKPALRPELAVGESLRAIAHDILSAARTAIESPDHTDAVAVHEFRREMKRWRAYLRLLEPFLAEDGATFQNAARALARDLGGARDPQTALEALDDLTGHTLPLSERSLKTVRSRIEVMRTVGESTALSPDMRQRIADALTEATGAVDRWPLHIITYPDVAKRLAAGYRAARRAVPENWSEATPETLHELRKLVVTHRNQMQIIEPLWQRFTKMWIAEAQRLRERLGQHHDLHILQAFTEPHHPLAPWRARLAPAIAARQHRHLVAAKRLATRLFVEKPAGFRRRLNVMWETG